MKKSLLLTAAALLAAPAAFSADAMQENNAAVNYKDNGGYAAEQSTEQTDANGVKHETESKTDVDYDSNGNMKETTVNSDTVKQGLLNRKTNETKTDYQQTNDGGYTKTTTSEHLNTNGTNLETTSKTRASVDANGNDVAVTKTQNTIDPPGLMNKSTTTNTTKTVNGVVVEDQE